MDGRTFSAAKTVAVWESPFPRVGESSDQKATHSEEAGVSCAVELIQKGIS